MPVTLLTADIGHRFGSLTVVGPVEKRGPRLKRMALVVCDCGISEPIWIDIAKLFRGSPRACKTCSNRANGKLAGFVHATHGLSKTPENTILGAMHSRTKNPSCKAYPWYGARGIKVCDRWSGPYGVINFVNDMGQRPSPKHSIERLDVNGDYTPENCCWATKAEQDRNRRNSVLIAYNGETLCASQWSARLGGSSALVYQRLKAGWSSEDAVTVPSGMKRPASVS